MDGKTLLYGLRQLLQEMEDSTFLDDYSSYWYLWEAAVELVHRTKISRNTQPITTVASQNNYDLNPDYLGLYLKNDSNNFYIKYSDGTNNYFPTWEPYEELIRGDQEDTEISIPNRFTIIDKASKESQLTGTATLAGAASGGQCTLTDSAADFSSAEAGDVVHNTTDGSTGIVLSKTSTTALVVALFNGTANDWTIDDAYVIQPQFRFELIFDPTPSTESHTATVYYFQRPAPVFSSYGTYRFPSHFTTSLIKYAAWLYKYRDKVPETGDALHVYFDRQIANYMNQADHILRDKRFRVNLKA